MPLQRPIPRNTVKLAYNEITVRSLPWWGGQ